MAICAPASADCTASWCKSLKGAAKKRFARECPVAEGQTPTEAVISLAMSSRAVLCVIPMQDYLELTNAKGRMNTPSVAEGNWQWRVAEGYATVSLKNKILSVTEASGRR